MKGSSRYSLSYLSVPTEKKIAMVLSLHQCLMNTDKNETKINRWKVMICNRGKEPVIISWWIHAIDLGGKWCYSPTRKGKDYQFQISYILGWLEKKRRNAEIYAYKRGSELLALSNIFISAQLIQTSLDKTNALMAQFLNYILVLDLLVSTKSLVDAQCVTYCSSRNVLLGCCLGTHPWLSVLSGQLWCCRLNLLWDASAKNSYTDQ